MGSKICMSESCRATTSSGEWKRGWAVKSGGFATLCYSCGLAYENLIFCETFHLKESGWRECKYCGKRIHCGCIASKYLHEYLDFGGIGCLRCIRDLETQLRRPIQTPSDDIPNRFGTLIAIGPPQSSFIENRTNCDSVDKGSLIHLGNIVEEIQPNHFPKSKKDDPHSSKGQIKREENLLPKGEIGKDFLHLTKQSGQLSLFSKPDGSRPTLGLKDIYEPLPQRSLSFSFSPPLGTSNSSGVVEGREKNKDPCSQQGQRTRPILPKPSKSGHSIRPVVDNKGSVSQTRVARPPAEGRGRNQLLPRYWPRITEQELQQLSGDLNSTIEPLFEKVLSASDAGRIGRLVLPKACAEAYFPPISQSEGLPIRIQDIKGKEWTFQFRFWPNNNSRMYVLEGVTPCIQNMQLQAGDTVTFSRIDPGGKLVMGFRKATNSDDAQEAQTSTLPNADISGETSFSAVNENLPTDTCDWEKNEEHGGMTNEDSLQRPLVIPEKKKSRNIGSKSKRLRMHSEDALELRITWEEAQELLRPPPSAKPTIVVVEDHEFEEYDEPPVFGKKTIFTARASGELEQWAQCDSCFKWRSLPVDVLLPPKWTCSDNTWDSNRCSCSAPDEMDPKRLEFCYRASMDLKRRRITDNKVDQECEPYGLDALATAAVLGDNAGDSGEPSVGATTRHPRHRPGCTCIVCIQPPSGKGKHKPTCICNVCLTVKRRFKTLMLRKKKRQSEREAEIAQGKDQLPSKDEPEVDPTSGAAMFPMNNFLESESGLCGIKTEIAETSKGHLDLNCDPNREDDLLLAEETGLTISTLVHAANLPLEMYLRQNGLSGFGPCLLSKAANGSEGPRLGEGCLTSIDTAWKNDTE